MLISEFYVDWYKNMLVRGEYFSFGDMDDIHFKYLYKDIFCANNALFEEKIDSRFEVEEIIIRSEFEYKNFQRIRH